MLKIDPILKDLIPPLQPDEYKVLEESKAEGCRDKIVTWRGYIVDGHNRYDICTRYGIEYETDERFFEDIEAVKVWMIDNQKGRRNLTDGWKWELAQTRKAILAEKGREKQAHGETAPGKTVLSIVDKSDKHNTRDTIAQELGWSTGKVAMADKVWKEADPEVKEKVKAGEVSINKAYNDIRKQEKRERNNERKQAFDAVVTEKNTFATCYNGSCLDYLKQFGGKIDLVLTDPPYAMDYKSGWNDWDKIKGDKRDDTLDLLDECFSLMKKNMKPDAHIYVFGNPNEMSAIQPIFERYYKLKNILIWDRRVIGMGDLKTYGRSYDVVYFGYNEEWKDLNGTRDRDILSFNRVSPGELIHPTEKPMDMLKYLIKKSSNEEDVVFDPFAGSCSTLKASHELNRNSYGCELENKYIPQWML